MNRILIGYPMLAVVLVLATAGGALGILPSWLVAVAVYGIPGFLITEVLMAGITIGRVERGVIALTTSVVLIVLGAQFLNLLPIGITPLSWILLLGGASVAAAAALVRMRWDVRRRREVWVWPGIARAHALRLTAAGLLAVVAVVIAVLAANVRTDAGFTQLWIDRSADSARISVRSQELEPGTYRLVVSTDPNDHTFTLVPGQTWTLSIQVPDAAGRIDVQLYLGDDAEPYRELDVEL